jgi:hypothetical protein
MAPDVGKVRPEIAPELGRGIHPEVAPEVKAPHSTLHLLYGPTIHDAVASGNLLRMKEVAREADRQLGQWGDLRTSLEILKVEIAKLEYKQGNK